MTKPSKLSSLLSPKAIESLALPSNLRYGSAIFERGGVKIIEVSTTTAEGWVGGLDGSVAEGGGQRRRTKLTATTKGLEWHCAGNPRNHQIFCKHCVALALAIVHK